MAVDLFNLIAIGAGLLTVIVGLAVKRITGKIVEDMDGFVGIIDCVEEIDKNRDDNR